LQAVLGFVGAAPARLDALLLEGEAGIGKSTVWRAGVDAAARELRVLVAGPVEAERDIAYAGLGDLFEGVLDEIADALPDPRRRALEVALLLAEPDGPPPDARAIGFASFAALRTLADRCPTLLAIDDLQWLDRSSAAALEFALRRLAAAPIRLLLARRGETAAQVTAALPSDRVDRLTIGPLTAGALQSLFVERLGKSLERPTLLRVHDLSAGNPLFALELARALEGTTVATPIGAPLPLPDSLDTLLRRRLDALPAGSRALLLPIAAAAEPTLTLLETGWPDAAHALGPLLDAEILALESGELRFTHPLLASAVLGQTRPGERRALHLRLAELIDDPVEAARHLALAGTGPDEVVAERLQAAAGRARSRGAPFAAAELGELAVRATPRSDRDGRLRRGLQVARDYLAAGAGEQARAVAAELLRHEKTGATRAEALLLVAEIEVWVGLTSDAVAFLQRALSESRDSPRVEAMILAQLAILVRFTDGIGAADELARRSLASAERTGDPILRARALTTLAKTASDAGDPHGLRLAAEALRFARATSDPETIDLALGVRGPALLWAGRLAEARIDLLERYEANVGRDEGRASQTLFPLAVVELQAGNWDKARSYADQQHEEWSTLVPGDPQAGLALALVATHQGDVERAETVANHGIELAVESGTPFFAGWYRQILGLLALWRGDASAAMYHFEAAHQTRGSLGFREPGKLLYVADFAEALLHCGRVEQAIALVDSWEEAARALGRDRLLAQAVRCRGLIAAAQGELDTATALLHEACRRHADVGDPFGGARALLALGMVQLNARQRRAARGSIEAAHAAFEALGASSWVGRAQSELGRIGGRARLEGLTPAEIRVAALVIEGRTNRETAAALFLSEKTVESHLGRIYSKLDVRTRTELASKLHDRSPKLGDSPASLL